MKKSIVYIVLIFFVAVYFISSDLELNKLFRTYRYKPNSLIGTDIGRYGDLYDGTYLPDYKHFSFMNGGLNCALINKPYNSVPKNINLYVIHDSYLEYLSDSMLYGVDKLVNCSSDNVIKLDKSKDNILLIETVERYLRRDFVDSTITFDKLKIGEQVASSGPSGLSRFFSSMLKPSSKPELEFNLFGYKLFTPLKEFKAQMNYKLFGRVNKGVSISSDKKYLFYTETTDTLLKTSSFNPIKDIEVAQIVTTLNAISSHYKKLGFDKVYFSIMPNPVSILNTEKRTYNQLIPRIQFSEDLKMQIIDIYTKFLQTKRQVYYNSDTHWNVTGFQLWLDEFNKELKRHKISTVKS